jgi:lipoprotein-releasing system ATP-binding protein
MLIEVVDIYKSFNQTPVLSGINLKIAEKSQVVLQGASGSGKSTLLYLLGGLDKPDRGQIKINSKNIFSLDDNELAGLRNSQIGFVFQFHFLLNSMDALSNILLPAKIGGHNISQVEVFVKDLAKRLGVANCLHKLPQELSGGEQQRINLIRAISLKPKILLCDEPTGNLDSKNSQIVMNLLRELATEFGSTLLVVTHDDKLAKEFPLKLTIEDGRIIG